jgi:CubicO group peptidase (beta-lactamase class C family)
MDKRQVKLGLYGFLVMLIVSLVSLKPYLGRALYHNFATIYDYKFFDNREIPAKAPGQPWPISVHALPDPDAETAKLLTDNKTTALLVLENGQIVYEKYFGSGGVDTLSGSFSMAKSIVALLYGIALQEGRIQSLSEPVSHYLTEWEDRDEGKITIENLLTMASGLKWNESVWNPFSITAEAYYGKDLRMTALRQQLIDVPGKHFRYQSGSVQLLGLALSRAVNENLAPYFSRKLWIPLGAEKDALWSLDHEDGMEKAFCCVTATARDFARLGELVRLHGNWQGKTIINANYIQKMLTPTQLPDVNGKTVDDYGYLWWILKTPEGNVPYALGLMGQFIAVVPQKNRVVVRLGMKSGNDAIEDPPVLRAVVNWAMKAP